MLVRPVSRLVWVLAFLVLTLFVVYGAFGYLYVRFQRQLEEELGLRLVAVATGAASSLGGKSWDTLEEGDRSRVRDELQALRSANDVADIFLFAVDETTLLDLGGRYPAGEPNLALFQEPEAGAYVQAGLPVAGRLYEEEGVYLKSAYAPVLGRDGEVLGGVGVEASASFFEVLGEVRGTLVGAALVVLVGMALLGAGFARLLTSQARLETRLRRTETLATMGQMAAMLAHEVRNPLGIIRGAAERLQQRHDLAGNELFRFIPEEVDRLERTMNAYLEFARPGSEEEVVDLAASLRRTVQLVEDECRRRRIALVFDPGPAEVPVRADAHRLQQAFLNLILNARDAMPEGGELRIDIDPGGRHAAVVFRDTGVGMDASMRRRAVEPFVTSKASGSGLGLAVVRRVMDEAGGEMSLESAPGQGTSVRLVFPRQPG